MNTLSRISCLLLAGLFYSLTTSAQIIDEPHSAIGPRQNHSPIFLLHGFTGWGREEALGFNYWGGLVDVQEHLKKHDYRLNNEQAALSFSISLLGFLRSKPDKYSYNDGKSQKSFGNHETTIFCKMLW